MPQPTARSASPQRRGGVEKELRRIVKVASYDQRKEELRVLSGERAVDYTTLSARLVEKYKSDFIVGACSHLASAMSLFDDLPRPT